VSVPEPTWSVESFRASSGAVPHLLVHVPHAATAIPADVRAGIVLDDEALADELAAMTDWHTDDLAVAALDRADVGAVVFRNQLSRLVVDPERFPDEHEPMATRGMGAVYRATSTLDVLRRPDPARDAHLRVRYFDPYAEALADQVDGVLADAGRCTIVDLHSYPTRALRYELDPTATRPAVCVGTDPFHTPPALIASVAAALAHGPGSLALDTPFAGTYVPLRHYQRDDRVQSVMIELRRDQYLDEPSTLVPERFDPLADRFSALLTALA